MTITQWVAPETRTIADFLAGEGVSSSPVRPEVDDVPVVTVPVPREWREVSEVVFPAAYEVWAADPEPHGVKWADNAVVVVGRLSRPVVPTELLKYAYADSRNMPEWHETWTGTWSCCGFPSADIAGTYVADGRRLLAHTRYVVVDNGGHQYLVQLTVTVRIGNAPTSVQAAAIAAGLTIEATAAPELPTPAPAAVSDSVSAVLGSADASDPAAGEQVGILIEHPTAFLPVLRPDTMPSLQRRPVRRPEMLAPVRRPDAYLASAEPGCAGPIQVELDDNGVLRSLVIDDHAYARGPAALAAAIVEACRAAATANRPAEAVGGAWGGARGERRDGVAVPTGTRFGPDLRARLH
ncbi:LpqN/LpqT family lipoprotein [Nocardia stercoris]|uniref:Uncharacterized protein n=1 Tax=Nocardia stercoris TaxID=2483361 RepID=A0A3M2L2M6_9NOCA|nr:LpqN/LpqT family lipoprotein [Nocardia stercoris]RMI31887.1 hypothetical protein EBN03_17100 [Nocardia stercoris]